MRTAILWLIVMFLSFSPSPALALNPVVRIQTNGNSSSATLIKILPDGTGQYLTCAHGKKKDDYANIKMHGKIIGIDGTITVVNEEYDLALIEGGVPNGMKPMRVGKDFPSNGEDVKVIGYGHMVYAERTSKVLGEDRENELMIYDASARAGDSGGAVTYYGKLVGVTVKGQADGGRGRHDGFCVPIEQILAFLQDEGGWDK